MKYQCPRCGFDHNTGGVCPACEAKSGDVVYMLEIAHDSSPDIVSGQRFEFSKKL